MLLGMTNEDKRKIVLSGHLYKGLAIISLPIIFNNIMQTAYNLADTYFVSQISDSDIEVTALVAVWPIIFLILGFGMGLQVAGTSLMSQHIGANNKEKADKLASQLFLFSIILGIVFMVLGIFFSPYILNLMEVKGEVFKLGAIYLKIIFVQTPFIFPLMVFTAMRQAYGDTITPVIFTVISVILNIILDYLFIRIFHWGVPGAAIATVLAKVIIVPFWLRIAFNDKESIHLILTKMKIQVDILNQIIFVMIPVSFGQALNAIGFIVLNSFIYSYGDATLSAFGIGNRITSLVMMPAMGFGNALAFYVGQNIGNRNYKRAKQAFKASLILTLSMMGIGMLVILPYPIRLFIIKIFLQEKDTIALALEYMIFVGLNIPLMGLFQNYIGVFQGAGKTYYALIMFVVRLWGIRIPTIILFKNFTDFGSSGIWYAMVLSNVIVCIIGLLFYKYGRWNKRIV